MADAEILTDPSQNWFLPLFDEWLQINQTLFHMHTKVSVGQ